MIFSPEKGGRRAGLLFWYDIPVPPFAAFLFVALRTGGVEPGFCFSILLPPLRRYGFCSPEKGGRRAGVLLWYPLSPFAALWFVARVSSSYLSGVIAGMDKD